MDKKNVLSIGFVAPGWPLCDFPNGIVAYIQNLLHGLDDQTKSFILAQAMIDSELENDLTDVSHMNVERNFIEKMRDKIIHNVKFSCLDSIKYQIAIKYRARAISLAIQNLEAPLNILEIEESFGISHFLKESTKVPVVTRIHGPWFIHGPIMQMDKKSDYNLRVFYEGQAIKNSHGVTAPSIDVLNRVREHYGITLENAKVIPNPVLEVPIDKQWQYDVNNTPYILVVGRFDSHKGGDLALDAFRLIALKNKNIELLFVGPDRGLAVKGKPLKLNDYIEQFIPEDTIKKRIHFLGHCDQPRVSDLRKRALVTLVCSRYENFPLSLLEALATGCPTVATAVGGMKEIIINNYNGLLAISESPESIAEKALELIDDPVKMQLLSKNAIEDCKKRFSPEVVASQTIDYYKSLINKSGLQ